MTSAAIRRVQFLLQEQTQAEVSRQTGIPSSTLSYVARGLRDVPSDYSKNLRNYYERQSYSRLREASFSVTNAHRFKGYAPETVTQWINKYNDTVLKFTEGAASARLNAWESENGKASKAQIQDIFASTLLDIQNGIKNSKAPSEDITSDWY